MKRIILIFAAVIMLASIAMAESIDLTGMTTEELRALQSQINAEIVSRGDWKEVEVPAGLWEIGKDIPEGDYEIMNPDKHSAVGVGIYRSNTDQIGLKFYSIKRTQSIGKLFLESGRFIRFEGKVILKPVTSLAF